MPIYTYKCKNCGEIFEKIKPMSSNGLEKCGICSSEALRVFSPAGIIFKGSGFYTTDYKSASNKSGLSKNPPKDEKKEAKQDSNNAKAQAENKKAEDTKASSPDKSSDSKSRT